VGPTCQPARERGSGEVGRRWLLGRKGVVGLLRTKKRMGGLLGWKEEGIEVWFWLFFLFFFFFNPLLKNLFQFSKIILKTF
jgi:hypothetical protein